jgi:hypothetical protein
MDENAWLRVSLRVHDVGSGPGIWKANQLSIQIWDTGLSGGIPNFKTLVSMWILKKNQISDPGYGCFLEWAVKFLMASFDKYCKMYLEKFKFSTLLKHAL